MRVLSTGLCVVAALVGGCGNQPTKICVDRSAYQEFGDLDRAQTLRLDLGRGVVVAATIEVTTKGNGCLEVLNISPRIVDEHHDGEFFADGKLEIRLVDVNGDGYRDLVAWGVNVEEDEQEDRAIREVPISMVFLYDPKNHAFVTYDERAPVLRVR